jgi:hypothetical protein
MTTYAHGSERTIFADGEGITSSDLNQISLNSSQRAWEYPGYADILAFDACPGAGDFQAFSSDLSEGRYGGVFTLGGGLLAQTTGTARQSLLGDGFAGIWDGAGNLLSSPRPAATGMSWIANQSTDSPWSKIHDVATAGNTRYDLVHCAVSRELVSATRDYQDAATGAKTSQSTDFAEALRLDIQVTKGTESTGTPTMPSLPSDRHALYAVRVSSSAITEVHDFVIPRGPLTTTLSNLPSAAFNVDESAWASFSSPALLSKAGGAGYAYVFPPEGLCGNPNARLLGLRVVHRSLVGDTFSLVNRFFDGNETETVLLDFSDALTIDGVATTRFENVDFRGLPALTTYPQPFWGHGKHDRGPNLDHTLALKLGTAGGLGSCIFGLTWYYIAG